MNEPTNEPYCGFFSSKYFVISKLFEKNTAVHVGKFVNFNQLRLL